MKGVIIIYKIVLIIGKPCHFANFYANISFNAEKTLFEVTCTEYSLLLIRSTQRQFSENIYSEDDLRSRIFGTFVFRTSKTWYD